MLALKNVVKLFPNIFYPVLKNINLTLNPHDFCVLLGANGSGKSTLMKVIAGEYALDQGQIFINGQDVTYVDRNCWVSQVVQDINKGTIAEMTLLENIALSKMKTRPARLNFYQECEHAVVEELKELGLELEQSLNQPLSLLSGGQRQIVATMMAMNDDAKVLLLDEHTSALDPLMQVKLMEYTARSIIKKKLTTLMITHKIDDALKYGNRLIMLHQGQIVLDIAGDEKKALKVNDLLEQFHKYEDKTLISEVGHGF
jgi:putative ABC transport system ATP-binding protein